MDAKDAKNHMEDLKNELGLLLFHEETLKAEMKSLKPKFESGIVRPMISTIRNITAKDLEIDVIPADMASKETIEARKQYFYAANELAQITVAIQTKKDLYNGYKDHIKQELDMLAKPCTDTMIYDAYKKACLLDLVLNLPEREALDGITKNLPSLLASDKEKRLTLYETLQNIILQHS